jgi:hypothetical protein
VAPAAATLGEKLSSTPSTSSTEWNRRPLPLRGDRLLFPLGICRFRALRCGASPLELAELLSMLKSLSFVSVRRWKRQDVVLPVQLGEVLPRPRLVGRAGTASPCRPGMHLGVW